MTKPYKTLSLTLWSVVSVVNIYIYFVFPTFHKISCRGCRRSDASLVSTEHSSLASCKPDNTSLHAAAMLELYIDFAKRFHVSHRH